MNKKNIGDVGCNCTIGELSKYGIGVAFPLSDNYPFDLVAIAGDKLFKIQVRSSSSNFQGAISFKLTKGNWRLIKYCHYLPSELDIFALYDLTNHKLYLVEYKDIVGRTSFAIRISPSLRKQKTQNVADEYVISKERVKKLFGINAPEQLEYIRNKKSRLYKEKRYTRVCRVCKKEFITESYGAKYCSNNCCTLGQRRVDRPSPEQLIKDLSEMSMVKIGEKYGVSDNSIRKWAARAGIDCKLNDKGEWVWFQS